MYSIDADGSLTELIETPYELESHLQDVIATHPNLLGGDQMDAASLRRFLLVTKEASIVSAESSGGVFFLDLLFVDQDAILTLVEVKRSSDTRLRREVIGQLLEYAANVCAFWSAEKVRTAYEKTVGQKLEASRNLEETLGLQPDEYENYWETLQSNLDLQRLRLVLVADKISVDTLRIIEYLNRQMTNTEVFAVTVAQYKGGNVRTLTPRVLNPSLADTERKIPASRRSSQWTSERFYEELAKNQPAKASAVMRAIEDWARSREHVDIGFGYGAIAGSLQIAFHSDAGAAGYRPGSDVVFLILWTYGTIEIEFQYLAGFEGFRDVSKREELMRRLNNINFDIPTQKIDKRPNISWSKVEGDRVFEEFIAVQDWLVNSLASNSDTNNK